MVRIFISVLILHVQLRGTWTSQAWWSKNGTVDMIWWSRGHHVREWEWGSQVPRPVPLTMEVHTGRWQFGITWYTTRLMSMGELTVVCKAPNMCHFIEKVYCDPRLLTSSGSPQDPTLPHSSWDPSHISGFMISVWSLEWGPGLSLCWGLKGESNARQTND